MTKNVEQNLCIHLTGTLFLHGNSKSDFSGPIKKGLRLLLWGVSDTKATSCSFIHDLNVSRGESIFAEIVVLSPDSIDKKIEPGELYSVGFPQIKLGDFRIVDIRGIWEGKVP